MNKRVMVYGSLKSGRGFGNHSLIEHCDKLGDFTTPKEYTMYHLGGFPGIVCEGNTAIVGEVYEVDDDTFSRLDLLEGYPHFYNRKEIKTDYGDAWIYFLAKNESWSDTIVENGEW